MRSPWLRIFHHGWILSLILFLALGGLRAYGLFGLSSARILIMLNFLLMWFLPFIFFTKEGRQAMGLKRVEHPRWLGWGLLFGMVAALIVFGIGWGLYGRSADNCMSVYLIHFQSERSKRRFRVLCCFSSTRCRL